MDGKGWNRAIRVHKLTVEALWSILWERFKEWATENEKTVSENLQNAAKRVAQGFANKDDNDIQSSLEDLLSQMIKRWNTSTKLEKSLEDLLALQKQTQPGTGGL
ncbi:hypothetical protein ACOMHN_016291 [Nucella lapillus]